MEKCTHPGAPFYHADLVILEILESYGIDIPCVAITQLMIIGTGVVALLTFCAISLIYVILNEQPR